MLRTMWKNSHIHLLLETELLDKLKKEAQEASLTLSELCRRKLKEETQLSRIEKMLIEINKKFIA